MSSTHPLDSLFTVRDWLRYAVSRFSAADLSFGHGTSTALDEAAFLILHTLHLPIEDLAPWLDARLIGEERAAVLDIIEQRIVTRKPASYLTGVAYIGGHRFRVDERVIVPRSYIGELLCRIIEGEEAGGMPPLGFETDQVRRVLDLCTGGGSLAILAALAFPEATVDAVDISADALAVAGENVAGYGLDDRIALVRSDLWSALDGERYDLILANPPYVASAEMAAFPPEHAAEPSIAHAGGEDGLDIVRRILADAGRHLDPDGHLVIEIGTGGGVLEAERPDLPFVWLDTATSQGEVTALPAGALLPVPPR